jgi:endo-1,4-beta-D-glucanase Y
MPVTWRPRDGRRFPLTVLALPALVVILLLTVVVMGERAPPPPPREELAAAEHFLDTFVGPDGRVVRRDQGGDTVSEGQAYGMLLAVAVGDESRFARVWDWTRRHLERPDSLLSWHWQDGRVTDDETAADADLDAAFALIQAATRFGERSYREDALRLAHAIRRHEVVHAAGRALLVAGTWATESPFTVNPSYLDARALAAIARETGDSSWNDLAAASYALLEELMGKGVVLPPDWAVVDHRAVATPAPPPGQPGAPVRYSLDAARIPVRLAAACDPRARKLAAALWPVFDRQNTGAIRMAYDLGGGPVSEERHPLTLVGAAAAAHAAGSTIDANRLLDAAESLHDDHPTYYGAAWVALGHVMLHDAAHTCAAVDGQP